MKAINNYFFGYEEISIHDKLWMYGGYATFFIITGITVFSII